MCTFFAQKKFFASIYFYIYFSVPSAKNSNCGWADIPDWPSTKHSAPTAKNRDHVHEWDWSISRQNRYAGAKQLIPTARPSNAAQDRNYSAPKRHRGRLFLRSLAFLSWSLNFALPLVCHQTLEVDFPMFMVGKNLHLLSFNIRECLNLNRF